MAYSCFNFSYFYYLLLYWLVPICTTFVWIGSLIELVEHYPLLEGQILKQEADKQLYQSRNRIASTILSLVFMTLHLVHHLFPKVPFYRVAEVHKARR